MTPSVRYLRDDEGHRVAYTVHGSGPDLVLPAWWVSHVAKDWEHASYRAFLERLGGRFRVVRYDRPGVGLSDRDVEPRSFAAEVRLLATMIDATATADRVSLFAFSCGSPVALAYAADNAARLDRICVYGGYLAGTDIAAPDVCAAVVALVRAHWGAGSRTLADLFLPGGSREEVDALSRQQRDSTSPETAAQLLELTYAMDATDCIPRVTTEVRVLHRTGDRAIPCEAGRRLAASLPGAPFTAFEGRAHPPWFADGPDIATPVIRFLTGDAGRHERVAAAAPGPGLCLDEANRCAVIGGDPVPLTPLEYGVMRYLVRHGDRVVGREELLEHVWKTPIAGSNKVDVLVRALRRKLAVHAHSLQTVAGHGYRLRGWKTG